MHAMNNGTVTLTLSDEEFDVLFDVLDEYLSDLAGSLKLPAKTAVDEEDREELEKLKHWEAKVGKLNEAILAQAESTVRGKARPER